MNIIIIANFPSNLEGGAKGRFLYLGEMLCERGHQVEMVISDFDHGRKQFRAVDKINYNAYKTKITVLHESGYGANVSLKRLWSHYIWGKNVGKYLNTIKKPSVVYCAIPSLTAARKAAVYCKMAKIKFIVDLQDLWPEAFAMVLKNKMLQKLFLPMKWYVDKVYASADKAIAVSDSYVKRILSVNSKIATGTVVYLGNSGELFDQGREMYHLERTDEEIVLGYIGNMSTSYDIPCVLDALAIIEKQNCLPKPIRFVLIGGGVDEEKFREYANKTYKNTCFLGKKEYREMVGLLCDCDIVINPIIKGSVASIINKVGDYALAGLPVINTQESIEYRNLIDEYQCGINCRVGNAEDVAMALKKLAIDTDLRKQMGANARKLGLEKFDRRHTYLKMVEVIEES